jgi:hypothetical protein
MNMLDIVQQNAERFGKFVLDYDLLRTDGDTINVLLHDLRDYHINAVNDLDVAGIDAQTVNTLTIQLISLTTTPTVAKSTADTKLRLGVSGYAPFGAVVVPLGDPADSDTWFDASSFDKVRLELTQGGAGATCQTILQQVRT